MTNMKKNYIADIIDYKCKLRRNGMTVPRERNGYSVFIGTKVPL